MKTAIAIFSYLTVTHFCSFPGNAAHFSYGICVLLNTSSTGGQLKVHSNKRMINVVPRQDPCPGHSAAVLAWAFCVDVTTVTCHLALPWQWIPALFPATHPALLASPWAAALSCWHQPALAVFGKAAEGSEEMQHRPSHNKPETPHGLQNGAHLCVCEAESCWREPGSPAFIRGQPGAGGCEQAGLCEGHSGGG